MNLLLDTNVLSEVRRPAPEPKVLAWLDTIDEDRAFISVASIAELRRGIALMDGRPASCRAGRLAGGRSAGALLRTNLADRSGDRRALGRRHGAGPPERLCALRHGRLFCGHGARPRSSCSRPATPRILRPSACRCSIPGPMKAKRDDQLLFAFRMPPRSKPS